jgi:hypothetical protein
MKRITTSLAPTVFLGAIAASGIARAGPAPLANSGATVASDSASSDRDDDDRGARERGGDQAVDRRD